MKKLIVFGFATLVLFGFNACKKPAVVNNTEETVNVSLAANQVYRYALPSQANAGNVSITGTAAKSNIAIVDSSNSSTLVYTPDQNFTGTDVVTIVHPQHSGSCNHRSEGDHHGNGDHHGCGHHEHQNSGHCHKGDAQSKQEGEHKIIFNITVNALAK